MGHWLWVPKTSKCRKLCFWMVWFGKGTKLYQIFLPWHIPFRMFAVFWVPTNGIICGRIYVSEYGLNDKHFTPFKKQHMFAHYRPIGFIVSVPRRRVSERTCVCYWKYARSCIELGWHESGGIQSQKNTSLRVHCEENRFCRFPSLPGHSP